MIKKVIFALMWIIGFSASVSAQSTEVFEGEIELETFENYSDTSRRCLILSILMVCIRYASS